MNANASLEGTRIRPEHRKKMYLPPVQICAGWEEHEPKKPVGSEEENKPTGVKTSRNRHSEFRQQYYQRHTITEIFSALKSITNLKLFLKHKKLYQVM